MVENYTRQLIPVIMDGDIGRKVLLGSLMQAARVECRDVVWRC